VTARKKSAPTIAKQIKEQALIAVVSRASPHVKIPE
jgi:hypothetical protein